MSDLALSRFTDRIGDRFRVVGAEPPLDLELVEAEPLRTQPGDGDAEHRFSLVFTGPADRPFDQQTVTLHHDEVGELALFAVPIAERDDRRHYEAVVNRTV